MKRNLFSYPCSVAALLLTFTVAQAQERALLFSKSPSESLQKVVDQLRTRSTPKTPLEELTSSPKYYVRIASYSSVFNRTGWLQDASITQQYDASLGGRPFVFVTSPESLYGRSLLEIFQDIGYEAESILNDQPNQRMVAIVFRYPDTVTPLPELTDGKLPANWDQHVYVPHWDNICALFNQLSRKATVDPEKRMMPFQMFFASPDEKAFALNASGKSNAPLKSQSYIALKVQGGDNGRYRDLLESKLGLYEHFRGTGRTWNEVTDPRGEQKGLVEFVGPNRRIKELPEVAIIDLGRMTISDTYQLPEPVAK